MPYSAGTVKRLRYKIFPTLALLAGALCALLFWTREPSADGRTLSEWLKMGPQSMPRQSYVDVTNAVRKIGTNAVPVLLRKVRTHDPMWKRMFPYLWSELVPDRWVFATHYARADGVLGLQILGPQAASAIPELGELLNREETCYAAMQALCAIGPLAEPVWRSALTNGTAAAKRAVMVTLWGLEKERKSEALWAQLRHLCHDADWGVRLQAFGLMKAHPEKPAVEQVFRQALADQNAEVLCSTLRSLRDRDDMVPNLRPSILPLLTHSNSSVRVTAKWILESLDPAALQSLDLPTNSTPRAVP